ncbi:hypothetical protein Mgra_00005823, partial [Meloidogyne graminicola]
NITKHLLNYRNFLIPTNICTNFYNFSTIFNFITLTPLLVWVNICTNMLLFKILLIFFISSFQQLRDLRIGVSSRLIYEGSPCDAFPCWNGGTCIELRKRKYLKNKINYKQEEKIKKEERINYFCKCNYYFTGKHCEQKLIKMEECKNQQFQCPNGTFCLLNLSNSTFESNNSSKTNLLTTTKESLSFLTGLFLLSFILFSLALTVESKILIASNFLENSDKSNIKRQFQLLRKPHKEFNKDEDEKEEEFELKNISILN